MFLCIFYYSKTIQDSEEGHSSVEDAVTTMELVKLKLQQCELNIYNWLNLNYNNVSLIFINWLNLNYNNVS